MTAAIIFYGIMILIFLLFGLAFARGKGQGLIAGYNTMSAREREKYDEAKLMKVMSRGMFALAGCMVLSLIGTLAGSRLLMFGGYALLLITAIVLAVLANTKTKKQS